MQWYPEKLCVGPDGTESTYKFMQTAFRPDQHFHYAEFGIYKGATASNVCRLFPNATLHLFDFHEVVAAVREKLAGLPNRIFYYGNSQKYNDSYNWALAKLIERQRGAPLFDYCFLDGAHTFAVDALNYFLCDRLLRVGGYCDFDDYGWRVRGSSVDPARVPVIADQYTEEQIDAFQVRMIVDLLVKPDTRYHESVANKVYRKVRE